MSTLLPKFTVGFATKGAVADDLAALEPSLSPSASVPTCDVGGATGVVDGMTPEILDM